MKIKILLKLICFNLIAICGLYGSPSSHSGDYWIRLPEYHILCHPIGVRKWIVGPGAHPDAGKKEYVTAMHKLNSIYFVFTRELGSWKDYLTNSNTSEDCFLQQAYQQLQNGYLPGRVFSDISPLLWQDHCKNKKIPYIEGYLYRIPNRGCGAKDNGFFRLYMFPTKDEKSTYYLFIFIEAFDKFEKHNRLFNEVFDFVNPTGQ